MSRDRRRRTRRTRCCQTAVVNLAQLEAIELQGVDGASHRLGDYWKDHRVLLVFLRHFG